MSAINVTDRERAAVLAALRMFQAEIEADGDAFLFGDVSTDCGRFEPPTTQDLETLIERLNTPGDAP